MSKPVKQRPISSFAALAVFALLALCILCVLLSGIGVYRRLVSGGQENYARRTATQYISTKIRQCPSPGSLAVTSFDGVDALVLSEDLEGSEYQTRVYCYDGWLMELYGAADGGLSPEDGEKLLPARELSLSLEDGLLRAGLTDENGRSHTLTFSLRGTEGGGT